MTRCAEVPELVAQLAAREIDPAVRRQLEAHLGDCRACSDEATDLRQTLLALQEGDVPDPGEAYWTAFDSRLSRRIAAYGRRSGIRRFLALAAAAILVVGLALTAVTRVRDVRRQAAQIKRHDAETHLEDLLEQAASDQSGLRDAQAILDEMIPVDEVEIEDALGSLSPEEREKLARDLSGTQG